MIITISCSLHDDRYSIISDAFLAEQDGGSDIYQTVMPSARNRCNGDVSRAVVDVESM